ncbi:OsmC family protein [Pseudolysinimonas sp.]|uniref:OsmC family protein n=1 Tax=Pseudolysinimonas sp. TaxID=2680009 RepID=UPI003F7EEE8F
MDLDHAYTVAVEWQGNRGTGTSGYRDYGRQTILRVAGKPDLLASADRAFHGDRDRWNPEDLLVASLSECHLLSYLHAATRAGVVVEEYTDEAIGTMRQEGDGGRFTEVVLRPRVVISAGDPELAQSLHAEAARMCFIAASVNFPVRHEPITTVRD